MAIKKIDVLLDVKKAEKQVEQLKESARNESTRIVKDSRRDSLQILDRAKDEAQRQYKVKIDAAEREMEEIKKQIIGEGDKRANSLKSKAQINLEQAVALIVSKFEDEVGNA